MYIYETYIRCKYLDPTWLLLSSCILEAERNALFICVPPLHLTPVKCNNLVLEHYKGFSSLTSIYMQ